MNVCLYFAACSANQQSTVTLTETSGTILNIREWLPVNAKCQWILTAPVGQVFRIDLRANFRSKSCSDDEYVRLYDGSSTSNNLMAETNCDARIIYSYYYSSGRSLLLELKTGPVVNTTRMDAKYQAHFELGKYNSTVSVSHGGGRRFIERKGGSTPTKNYSSYRR